MLGTWLIVLSFLLVNTPANAKQCKPIRANRNKVLSFSGLKSYSIISLVSYDDKYRLDYTKAGDTDRVLVYSGDKLINNVAMKNRVVAGPYIQYEEKGDQLVDSIDFKRAGRRKSYYSLSLSGSHVYATLNTTQHTLKYYNWIGNDSMMITRYADGVLKQQVISDQSGNDSLTVDWNEAGILSSKKLWGVTTTYYPDGVIKSRRFDTTIVRHVNCLKEYYSTGILRSVKYFIMDTPVHIWRYYNEEGVLARTERKRPVASIAYETGVVEAPPPPQIFRYVEQMPDFPGKEKYFSSNLEAVLCSSRATLKKSYQVKFLIAADGTVTFKNVEGINSKAIEEGLKAMFASMPQWRPGKLNGMRASIVVLMEITVRDKQPESN